MSPSTRLPSIDDAPKHRRRRYRRAQPCLLSPVSCLPSPLALCCFDLPPPSHPRADLSVCMGCSLNYYSVFFSLSTASPSTSSTSPLRPPVPRSPLFSTCTVQCTDPRPRPCPHRQRCSWRWMAHGPPSSPSPSSPRASCRLTEDREKERAVRSLGGGPTRNHHHRRQTVDHTQTTSRVI